MRVHCFQHVPFEGPGMIADWIRERGHHLTVTAFHETAQRLPAPDDYDLLLVMGGPMGVADGAQHPWLADEKRAIRAAIAADKAVLGICLGAQLLASCLGARVAPQGYREIGWFPVAVTDAAQGHPLLAGLNSAMQVFHWHGDAFALPEGALHLMASGACAQQAFLAGPRLLGLQFHLEMQTPYIQALVQACAHELVEDRHVQSAGKILDLAAGVHTRFVLYRLLDNWVSLWTRSD